MLNYSADTKQNDGVKMPAHQSVYQSLRDDILFGELAPGQQVTIQGIIETTGAGMTPVREAIRRLTTDEALKMLGNRRVIVPELTETDIEQLDFMRKCLEPELAGRAVAHATPALLDALKQEDNALNSAIERGDIKGYLTHNYQFHARLYHAADAPIMASMVDRLWLRFGPSLRVVCGRFGTMNLPDKHADLLAALANRDRQLCETAIREDIDQGMNQIRDTLAG